MNALQLEFDQVWCQRHGEPLRAEWPKGHAHMAIGMFALVSQDPRFRDETGGKVEAISGLLAVKPLCCRIDTARLVQLYQEAPFARDGLCRICKRGLRPGAPYRTARKDYRHVCFWCIVFRMEPDAGRLTP